MKTVNDIRTEFLGFFKKNGHEIVASSPLVPHNDPTLMFANSGMVQFKNVFLGAEHRDYKRATTAQKCVRAGGKHNDLDNVGYTARHHTFFEMLGNFSFGDYFKEEAISYAWELVTKNFGMPKDKLLVTVHTSDEDAAKLWKKIAGLPEDRIIRIPTDANFWMMGDTGPCGPCSEIFYDQGDKLFGGPPGSKDEDGDRFLEFWNNVFMQFEQEPDGKGGYNRKPLPKPSIDTGMGLERMAALMQGKTTNYAIDLLRDIIEHSADLTGVDPDGPQAPSHRVIADHLRASAFLMADGVMPSNEGRGYVLRRIMRRGMRHAHLLGAKEPLMHRLVPTLIAKMGEAYPELKRAEALIVQSLSSEESRFKVTLDRGLKMLDEETEKLASGAKFPGDVAFKLYDTYGFPLDLTQDALKAKGIAVDVAAFETAMNEQKARARASWAGTGDVGMDKLWFDITNELSETEFLGYNTDIAQGKALKLIKREQNLNSGVGGENIGATANVLEQGQDGIIIVNQTPFYAESGGQVGDTGEITGLNGSVFIVQDTKKILGKVWAHYGKVTHGKFSQDDEVELRVNSARRGMIRSNHSATHLLHEALRQVLGEHVSQKGSLQDAERTRFDISQPTAMTPEQIERVETIVNEEIRANTPVETRVMPLEEARQTGAMALFGEKYADEVRVVTMGTKKPGAKKPFSVELCGGTHVKRTGDIGLLKIISESALSSGIRRVEALTGANALRYFEQQDQTLQQVAGALKASPAEVLERVKTLVQEKRQLEKEVSELRRKVHLVDNLSVSMKFTAELEAHKTLKNGIKFDGRVLKDFPAKELKPMADDLKKKLGSGVIVLVATSEGKASIVVGVTDDLTQKVSAVELVKIGAQALGGSGGGGRADMAQAGGPNAEAANDAVSAIEKALA